VVVVVIVWVMVVAVVLSVTFGVVAVVGPLLY